jgi:hypothetical protein
MVIDFTAENGEIQKRVKDASRGSRVIRTKLEEQDPFNYYEMRTFRAKNF